MRETYIEVKKLTKRFNYSGRGSKSYCALNQINLRIYKGDIYGIIGMSGAGKSTLIRCLTALERPCEGSIMIQGEDMTQKNQQELNHIRQNIGMIFQHLHLFSSRTVAKNITYPMEIQKVPVRQQEKRLMELLSLVALEEKKDSYPSQLSGGEKQRVGIARALANHPPLLFCDEPTSALDPQTTQSILQLLSHLNQTLGLTMIIITHQLEVVKQICNRVAVLSNGEVIEEGDVKEVFTNPLHPITQSLLIHVNGRTI